MVQTKIRLADKVMEIHGLFTYFQDYCKDYICGTDEPADIVISIDEADIQKERSKAATENINQGVEVISYSDEYLETLAIYRKVADELLKFDTLLFHASVVAVDGEGYLFTARSGTGKSTHTKLWMDYFKDRAVMVNDDKPLLKVTEDGVYAYGTPWDGKHRRSSNISVPLKGICILGRSADNHIERISDRKQIRQIYPVIVQQTHRTTNPDRVLKTMQLIDELMKKVPLYRLGCNMDPEAALVSYEGMQKKEIIS